MSLIWHIVRKDLRRLSGPLGLWLALLLAHTLLVIGNSGSRNVILPAYEGFSYFASTWGVIIAAVGFILAAWLVMEDSLVSTQASWRTRPIQGARLLAAKCLGSFLMFSLLPVVVLSPVWLWCGFSAGEWAWSAADVMLQNTLISAAAMALASVTATSGQFLVRGMGAAVLLPVYMGYVLGAFARPTGEISLGVLETRTSLVLALLLVSPLAMLGHQFLTRRTGRSVAIFGLGLLLMLFVRFAWGWDVSRQVLKLDVGREARAIAADPDVQFIRGGLFFSSDTSEFQANHVRWNGTITGVPAGTYVRLDSARGVRLLPDKSLAEVRFSVVAGRVLTPPEQAVRMVAGLKAEPATPASWVIEKNDPSEASGLAQAKLNASLMRGRVLGELPLRIGAEVRVGSSFTRITGMGRVDDRVVVQLQERDAWPTLQVGTYSNSGLGFRRNIRPAADGFVLLDRAHAFDQLPTVREMGTIQANSLMVGRRELIITPPTRKVDGAEQEIPDWEESAVIIKVRFVPDQPFVRLITR
jgi:hypothetical protein